MRRIRVAHAMSIDLGARGILEAKLRALDAFPDIDVTLITPPLDPDIAVAATKLNHIVCPMTRPISPLRDLISLRRLAGLLRQLRPHVLHTHTAKAGFLGACAGRLAAVPHVIHTYHGVPFHSGQRWIERRTYRALERMACRWRDHASSQNREDVPIIEALIGKGRTGYEGNGVDIALLHEERAAAEFDPETVWEPGTRRLLMISRLEPVKRVADFVEVMQRLRSRGRPVSAAIAGPGRLHADLESLAERHGLGAGLRFLGWRSDVCALIEAADVVTLCSEKEGIPRSLMEAMALERPVVATDAPGTRELVVDGVTGYLAPLGDITAMTERLEQLLDDPDLRRRLGLAGARRIRESFDDRRIAEAWRDLYRSLDG